jgi:PPOX class probable F420-dependent enzyme
MSSPTTSVIPADKLDLLQRKALADVATIGPHGEPQVNPVWFGWDGTYVKFSQTTGRQKYRNLQRDNRIALSIVDPENPFRYLEIRGTVARVDPDPDKAFIDEMANKYLGVEKYPWNQPGDERVVIVVEPQHVTGMG